MNADYLKFSVPRSIFWPVIQEFINQSCFCLVFVLFKSKISNKIITKSFCLISVMHIFWNFTECMNKSKLFTFCFPETLQLFMVHARGKLDLSFIAGSLTKHLNCSLIFSVHLSSIRTGTSTRLKSCQSQTKPQLLGSLPLWTLVRIIKIFHLLVCYVFV